MCDWRVPPIKQQSLRHMSNSSFAFEEKLPGSSPLVRPCRRVYMTGETRRCRSSSTYAGQWCAVHPLPVLIILSLGVKEWRWDGGRMVVVTTGWLTQHPPWTGNRWDPTPSSQITAKGTLVCSRDRFNMTTTVYSNKRRAQGWGSEGNIEIAM